MNPYQRLSLSKDSEGNATSSSSNHPERSNNPRRRVLADDPEDDDEEVNQYNNSHNRSSASRQAPHGSSSSTRLSQQNSAAASSTSGNNSYNDRRNRQPSAVGRANDGRDAMEGTNNIELVARRPSDLRAMPAQPQPESQHHSYGRHTDLEAAEEAAAYNILPLQDILADHPALKFPEVRAAHAALRFGDGGNQRRDGSMDILDWLGSLFGFQADNVKNQREHITMLLANDQMRFAPDAIDQLDRRVVRKFHKKVLKNYINWCAFLRRKSNLSFMSCIDDAQKQQRELLYATLYLLIWGEAANLRFLPECLCYIFHNMAGEMTKVLDRYIDDAAQPFRPVYSGVENAFLQRVVTPIYEMVKAEAASASHDGKALPHSAWRNYDDINEFFWSDKCFTQLSWPLNLSCSFLSTPSSRSSGRRKIGFVEQRSFWNIFHSFDHLWSGHILMLQAMMILAFQSTSKPPWTHLQERDVQASLFSCFITWSGLRIIQSLVDLITQATLISTNTILVGVRMVLKVVVAAAWMFIFLSIYLSMWDKKSSVGSWTGSAATAFDLFMVAALVFILPVAMGLILFILPWIRNLVEKSNYRIVHILTWWFYNRSFVGRGLGEGIWDSIKYSSFWLLVFLAKFSFSYFLQIEPLVEPTRELLRLRNVDYSWFQFWGTGSNRMAVAALWAPVLLVYLMDMQIWYTVFSAFAGALVGLWSHIGEIRNMYQLRLRFPFLPSAMSFSLAPAETSLQEINQWGSLQARIVDSWTRIMIRYGFGTNYKKLSPESPEVGKFSFIWNYIVTILRDEDLLSDKEVRILEMPISNPWNIGVTQWPCVILGNELQVALLQAKKSKKSNTKRLWKKIRSYEYRRCAVVECYQSIRYIFLEKIIQKETREHRWLEKLFLEIQTSLDNGMFLERFKVQSALPDVLKKVLDAAKLLAAKPKPDKLSALVRILQDLYEAINRDFRRDDDEFLESQNVSRTKLMFDDDVIVLPDAADAQFYQQLGRFITILETTNSGKDVPKNIEAQRRIAFFCNSLFMNLPRAPPVEKMLGFSVLTPYYSESVMYSKKDLEEKNEDGITILHYLKTIYNDEWDNFVERMGHELQDKELKTAAGREKFEMQLWGLENALQIRLWASYRGQTLSRTVRGMMYYHRALKLLSYLDGASMHEIQQGRELVSALPIDNSSNANAEPPEGSGTGSGARSNTLVQQEAISDMKFTYVVTCQIYGAQKEKKEAQADDILFLMKSHPGLRIAYVDEAVANKDGNAKKFFSVLVKYDARLEREVEIYRIQLPGPLKLGEGKPENQNHAIIFTRGDAVQTIDMNQDNYFEETLKARNLLQEFTVRHGLRRPQILGVREHVFTGSVSSLASFMSAQETSFVTLGQRVLANPLKVRMHYGHPDVFDRLWFMTRGGISKASKVINISEDIFAGFNCTLRGGNVTHHEYIQAGKGRDVGLNQVALFEAKVASGNGEQILSRDVYRLGHRLDFFRMVSFYYTTVGFFISNLMVVLTVYAFLWGRVYLALSGLDSSVEGQGVFSNSALTASLNQQFLFQLGIFTALPMIVENSLERGFANSVWDFIKMQLQLSSVFFTFSMGTRAHFFGRTVLHGGAKYRATGRGFVVVHEKLAHIYRLFARSHFVKAVELIVLLVVYQSFATVGSNATAYILITFSSWFLAMSWILAPFLFNPSGFESTKIMQDIDNFLDWIWLSKGLGNKPEHSWEAWWEEELDHLKSTGFWGKVLEVVLDLRFFFLQYGIVYKLQIADGSKSVLVYILSWAFVAVVTAMVVTVMVAGRFTSRNHNVYRLIQLLVMTLAVSILVVLALKTSITIGDVFLSLLAFVPTGWGLLSIAVVFREYLEKVSWLWEIIVSIARIYELLIALIVFIPIVILMWLPGFNDMQTRILFNTAFSRSLNISRLFAIVRREKSPTVVAAAPREVPKCKICQQTRCNFKCLPPKDAGHGAAAQAPLLSYAIPHSL